MTDDRTQLDRARGALLGLAVGDALGTTYEFARIEQPAYPTLATQPATDVVGDGPFGLAPGAITDDT
ncbi:MAG: ADP-ribosylglycohydrolase family protein, partial [Kofleriaceae bacterium]